MADVIEKLKEYAQYSETKSERDTFEVAFQEIARLREENEQLMGQLALRSESAMAKDMQEIMRINETLREENARLREEVERLKSEESCNDVLLEYAQAETQRLREENAWLLEALKPFAYYASQIPDDVSDTASASGTVGDLRAAAAAIRETGK